MGVEERSVKASPLKLPLPKSEPLALAISVTAGGREIFKEVLGIVFGWLPNAKHLQSYTIFLFGYSCYSSPVCNSNLAWKITARGLPGSPALRVFHQKAL